MKRAGEMGVDTYLCGKTSTEYGSFKSAIPHGIVAVGDDGVDMGRAGEEAVHAHDARGQLVVLVTDECGLLELHGDGFDILARV